MARWFVLGTVLLCAAAISYLKFDANNDALGYLGLMHTVSGSRDPCRDVQADTASFPELHRSAKDCSALQQSLPFYAIRPAYIGMAVVIYRLGLNPVMTLQVISLTSYVALGLFLFYWLNRYGHALALTIPTVLAFSAVARIATPDMLSALLGLVGLYLIYERKHDFYGMLVLLFSIAVRTDNIFLFAAMYCYLGLEGRLKRNAAIAYPIAAVLCFVFISRFAYGWATLFWFSFIDQSFPIQPHVTPMLYVVTTAKNALLLMMKPTLYLLVPLIAFAVGGKTRGLLALLIGLTAFKFLLYPTAEQRHLLVLVAFSVVAITEGIKQHYGLPAVGHVPAFTVPVPVPVPELVAPIVVTPAPV